MLMEEMGRFTASPRKLVLGFKVPVATTLKTRLLGLAFLDRSAAGEGLLIPRCRSVHTIGMRFPLDLVFLDAEGRVIEHRRGVKPGGIIRCAGAEAVLELPD
jgi:uncharacterized membrane protein (UPF0127 family)